MSTFASVVTSARVARRLEPLPLSFAAIGGLGCAALAIVVTIRLHDLAGPDCVPPSFIGCGMSPEFQDLAEQAGRLGFAIGLLPMLIGALLGAPLVARELEFHTASIAWSLGASRSRWLIWRAAPTIVLFVIVLAALSLAGDQLTSARYPTEDPTHTFDDYGLRGPLVVARGLAAFAVAVAIGAHVRRVLQALLLAIAFCFALLIVSQATRTLAITPTEISDQGVCLRYSCTEFVTAFRDGKGRIVSSQEVRSAAGAAGVVGGPHSDAFEAWVQANGYEQIDVGITGEAYPLVETREAAGTFLIAALAAGAAVITTRRARVD